MISDFSALIMLIAIGVIAIGAAVYVSRIADSSRTDLEAEDEEDADDEEEAEEEGEIRAINCPSCSFSTTEAYEDWDVVIRTGRCPECSTTIPAEPGQVPSPEHSGSGPARVSPATSDTESQNKRVYKIFVYPNREPVAVKIGWSWPGFLFSGLWALSNKMWGEAMAVFTVSFLLIGVESQITSNPENASLFINIIYMIPAFLLGLEGNEWLEKNLIKRGYAYETKVEAQTSEEAVAIYLNEKESTHKH